MASETDTSGAALGGHEPSYYEIALTNRQVVFAFIILLVCLVATFFSGVWVGTRGEERAAAQRAQLSADKGDKVAPEGQSLEEFKFFAKPGEGPGKDGKHVAGDADGAAASSADGAKPGKGTTLAEDVAKPAAAAPASSPPPPQAPPTPLISEKPAAPEPAAPPARAAADPKPAKGSQGTPPPPAPERVETTVHPRTVPEAPPAAAPAAHPGDVIIQVFSSADEDQADKVRDRLIKSGQQAFLSPIDKAGKTMYRVRIGPFSSRDSAEKVAEKVRKEQRLDTWVTTP